MHPGKKQNQIVSGYIKITLSYSKSGEVKLKNIHSSEQDKGQYEELIEFTKYIKGNSGSPIPLWQMIQATEVSFRVEKAL